MNLSLKSNLALVATIVAIGMAGTGCAGKPKDQTGAARVSVDASGLAVAADVAKLTITVTGTGINPPISIDLTKAANGLSWSGFLGGIPAGNPQTFSATAFSLSGGILYQGTTNVAIVAGQLAQVVIILQEVAAPTTTENVPGISSFTASNLNPVPSILPGAPSTVQLVVTATDRNTPAAPLTYLWAASCGGTPVDNGSFSSTTIPNPVWTAPQTTPGPTTCTISTTVTNSKGSSVQTFITLTVALTNGSANISAFVNTNPVITGLFGKFVYNRVANLQTADFSLTSSDPDGDNLAYAWTVTPAACAAGTLTTSAPVTVTTPRFSVADATLNCTFTVVVTDLCTAGNCGGNVTPLPAGARADGAPRGGQVTGIINGFAPPASQGFPVVVRTTQPVGGQIAAPGAIVNLGVFATDPQGGALSFVWTAPVNGSFVAASQVDSIANGTSFIQLVAPNPLSASMPVTVAIRSAASALTTTYTFNLTSANPCVGKAAGALCDSGNLCVARNTETCSAAGVCGGGTPTVTCTASGACGAVGTCNPATGICSSASQPNGTSCSANACLPASCQTGVCTPGTAVTCTTPGVCRTAVGATCATDSTGAAVCNYPLLPVNTSCSANQCTPATCSATGACVAGTPVTCAAPGLCQTAAGASCAPATGLCTYPAATVGTVCTPTVTPACTTGFACTATSTCVGTQNCTVATTCCPGNQVCNAATGACVSLVPTPSAKVLFPAAAINAAANQAGDVYLAGPLFQTQTVGTTPLTSDGSADLMVAKYTNGPLNTPTPVWAVKFSGGASEAATATDQIPVGAAVTGDDTVVVIGSTSGSIVVNGATVAFPAAPQDFIIGVNGATGAGKFAIPVNNGTAGALLAVAGNPNSNNFAVCGYTNIVSSLAQAGVVAPTGTQATDAVIGVYTSAGVLVWSKQIASGSFEDCSTLAMDDAGHVLVAGKYGSATAATSINPGLGALPATGLATRRFIWVAKYDGATGAPIAQAGYGAGNGIQVPRASTVDAGGNLILGGSFVASLPFGTGALTLAGVGQDGFIAKLGVTGTAAVPGAFTPAWAVRLGGTGNTDAVSGLSTSSAGEVFATGTFATTSTGALTLTSSGLSDDVFVIKLDPSTAATQFQAAYGDGSAQAGGSIFTNRTGTVNRDLIQFTGTLAGTVNFGGTAGSATSASTTGFLVTAPLQ